MHERKAASVLPDPVGAAISTSVPDAMAGQLLACTSVGELKRPRNHSAMIGWNCERGMRDVFYHALLYRARARLNHQDTNQGRLVKKVIQRGRKDARTPRRTGDPLLCRMQRVNGT